MKKIVTIILILSIFSCKKEEVTKKLDLNGTYEGTLTGWSQPMPVSGTAVWQITHTDNKITANISHPQLSMGWLSTLSFNGTVVNDTTITGNFVQSSFPTQGIAIGKISNNGNNLVIETSPKDDAYNYVRVKYNLTKK